MQSLGRVSETFFVKMRKDSPNNQLLAYRRMTNGKDFQVSRFETREDLVKRICKQDQNSRLNNSLRWVPCVPITESERY